MTKAISGKKKIRWHIAAFLLPAVMVYALIMILPLLATLKLSLYDEINSTVMFVGLENFKKLFTDPNWSEPFWNALINNIWLFVIHMCVQNPIGILLAALLSSPRLMLRGFYHSAIILPSLLSLVVAGLVWKLILSPLWGVAPSLLELVGLESLFLPWLGKEAYAMTTLSLVSVWQYIGIPMMLIYSAMLSIPDQILEAGECDGLTGFPAFWKIKLPLILPTIGIISILTFIANFSAFDLIYASQGLLAGPNFSTDILGTFMFRTLFGSQLQLGDAHMAATIAAVMFVIILVGVCVYLFGIHRRLRRYRFQGTA